MMKTMAEIKGEPIQLQPLKRVPNLVDLHNLLTWLITCQESYLLEKTQDALKHVLLPWSQGDSRQLSALGISLSKKKPEALPVWIFYKNLQPHPQIEWSHATRDISLIHNLLLCSFPEEQSSSTADTGAMQIVIPKNEPSASATIEITNSNKLAPVLAGSLQKLRMDGLLQSLASSNITGKLLLSTAEKKGAVFFESGRPVHCEFENDEGHQAMLELMSWSEGNFEVIDNISPPKKSITRRMESLLMESAMLTDYMQHLENMGINTDSVLEKIPMTQQEFVRRMKDGVPVEIDLLRATAPLINGVNSIGTIARELAVPKSQWLPAIFNFVKVGVVRVCEPTEENSEKAHLTKYAKNIGAQGLLDPYSSTYTAAAFQLLIHLEWNRYKVHHRPFSTILIQQEESLSTISGAGSNLAPLAKRLKQILRLADIVCHYKRHDLCVILPETNEENAALIAAQLNDEVTKFCAASIAASAPKIKVLGGTITEDSHNIKEFFQKLEAQPEALPEAAVQAR